MNTILETRKVRLRPLENADIPLLHKWRNCERYMAFCSIRRMPVSEEQFRDELKTDFENDRHLQFMIEVQSSQKIVGTIFSYNLNRIDGYVFVTVFIDEQFEKRGHGPQAFILLIEFLFKSLPIEKIYIEVYGYNDHSLANLTKKLFEKEGHFKHHRFWDGSRHDMMRYAIYRDKTETIKKFLQRLR